MIERKPHMASNVTELPPKIAWSGAIEGEKHRIIKHSGTYYIDCLRTNITCHFHLERLTEPDAMGCERWHDVTYRVNNMGSALLTLLAELSEGVTNDTT